MKIIETEFLKNNKIGTIGGTPGNICFNDKQILKFIEKYFDSIETENIEYDKNSKIYSIGNGYLTLKENVVLTTTKIKEFNSIYRNVWDYDFELINLNDQFDLLCEVFTILIEKANGLWRFDGFDEYGIAFFETE